MSSVCVREEISGKQLYIEKAVGIFKYNNLDHIIHTDASIQETLQLILCLNFEWLYLKLTPFQHNYVKVIIIIIMYL